MYFLEYNSVTDCNSVSPRWLADVFNIGHCNAYQLQNLTLLSLSLSLISAEHNLSNNVDTEDTSPFGGCPLWNIAK